MLNGPLAVRHMKVRFVMTLLTVQISLVGVVSSIAVILFDTIVVAVTLAGTLGTWKVC